jgi:nitroreductase/Pyruvate/2-oxoacid:ferredoxin oxidoreductase delta subunit
LKKNIESFITKGETQMPSILIDHEVCSKCNTCSIVCVLGIIEKATPSGFPEISEEKKGYCIKCGHCESFCPQKALTLDFLLNEKIVSTAKDSTIDPQNLTLYLKNRRSVRHFSTQPVDKDLISCVIDAARYAASGGNSQPVKWLVIYDSAEVKDIAGLTIDWMRVIQNTAHPLAPYVPPIISKWDDGVDLICHNAPHLVFAHIPYFEEIDDPTDAIIAMTHFDIVAPSYGLGTCWAGFVQMAAATHKPLIDALALPEGRKTVCPMMFGYPLYMISSIPRRNPVEIIWR